MASLSKDRDGGRRIQFINGTKQRKAIRLGQMPLAAANEFKRQVEALNWAMITKGTPDVKTAQWLNDLDPVLHEKLERVGLVDPRQQSIKATIGGFFDFYLQKKRADFKPNTLRNLLQVRKELVLFFGEHKPMAEVTDGDAEDWRSWLSNIEEKLDGKIIKSKLGENTVRRHCGRARQLFRNAIKRRLITNNPFGEMKGIAVQANKAREFFVTHEMTTKVLEACPDAEWKLLFALSRYAGLRCPSEHLALRWSDINWAKNRMKIRSPKTEGHQGKESRVVPIFAELRPYLDAVWDEPPEEAEYVISRYRDANCNLRTQLERIIRKAGLVPWPKLFQNLRSTRETELAEEFPIHVVCAWLGNSQAVAKKHYLQVTDEHFKQAADAVESQVAHYPAHQGSPACNNSRQRVSKPSEKTNSLDETVPPAGLEPATPCLEGRCSIHLSYGGNSPNRCLPIIIVSQRLRCRKRSGCRGPPPANNDSAFHIRPRTVGPSNTTAYCLLPAAR